MQRHPASLSCGLHRRSDLRGLFLPSVFISAVLCTERLIRPRDLPPAVRLRTAIDDQNKEGLKRLVDVVDDFERTLILDALERAGWVKTAAARLLGISVKLLDYRIEKYGIAKG